MATSLALNSVKISVSKIKAKSEIREPPCASPATRHIHVHVPHTEKHAEMERQRMIKEDS